MTHSRMLDHRVRYGLRRFNVEIGRHVGDDPDFGDVAREHVSEIEGPREPSERAKAELGVALFVGGDGYGSASDYGIG